jgi:LPS-assembly protein
MFANVLIHPIRLEGREEESFKFTFGDKIHVLSDKAFRKTKEDEFEAIGNVVILHGDKTLYGEKAKVSFVSGDTTIEGNVRFVAPNVTMYGTKLDYNIKTKWLSLQNARIITPEFVVLGKELTRASEETIYAVDAEYTTCKDCPESWSVFGRDIQITVGEYVKIKHAYIKVNGVIMLYLPYIVFPIKKERETGMLFPNFSIVSDEGFRFSTPWFWAINDKSDLTFAPGIYGKRGWGGELEYRQVLADKKWFELNSFGIQDRIYEPYKKELTVSGNHDFRNFSSWEHHFSSGYKLNHHFRYYRASDYDTIRDLEFFTKDHFRDADLGLEGFVDYHFPLFYISTEANFKENLLTDNYKQFDNKYVQVLPKVNMQMIPVELWKPALPFFHSFSLSLDTEFASFKQNHFFETNYVRNANRADLKPKLDWNMGNVGPLQISQYHEFDYQNYQLPKEKDSSFYKQSLNTVSEVKIEFEKIYGVAYEEQKQRDKEDLNKRIMLSDDIVGEMPLIQGPTDSTYSIVRNSYRHSQAYVLRHYLTTLSRDGGNDRFRNQLINFEADGIFDYRDTIRRDQFEYLDLSSITAIPNRNTLELQWNHTVTIKSPKPHDPLVDEKYLRENFSYDQIVFLNLSQGYNLEKKDKEFNEALTRLHMDAGYRHKKTTFSLSEFYFYNDQDHIFNTSITQEFSFFKVFSSFEYNTKTTNRRFIRNGGYIRPIDIFEFGYENDYNLEEKRTDRDLFSISYLPLNNCWQLNLKYERDLLTEEKFSLNFAFNYDGSNFTSLTK